MCMISTMCRSMGSCWLRMVNTASTTMSVSFSPNPLRTLVHREVLATQQSISRSGFSSVTLMSSLNLSRNSTAARFATSSPSTSTRGCTLSARYLSAARMISPIRMTVEEVPSPVTSSCATAARAIITAVGFWICISRSSTFPSLVSLTSPAPPTSIFTVPLGPRLVRSTSSSPLAACRFMWREACGPIRSAFGLRLCNVDEAMADATSSSSSSSCG
mmetsp:Transcript_1491/g.9124  ORF Transcript_1491/g.9124 Transcript_1491/m.9124 type:complete len:217 (-) Transcript_1491:24-674(-)